MSDRLPKRASAEHDDPYRLFGLATQFDPILNPDGTMKESRHTPRPIEHLETTIVNDTNKVIAIFNGELSKSDHFIDGKPRYNGPVDACIYLDKSARPVCDIVAQLWPSLSLQRLVTTSRPRRF